MNPEQLKSLREMLDDEKFTENPVSRREVYMLCNEIERLQHQLEKVHRLAHGINKACVHPMHIAVAIGEIEKLTKP